MTPNVVSVLASGIALDGNQESRKNATRAERLAQTAHSVLRCKRLLA